MTLRFTFIILMLGIILCSTAFAQSLDSLRIAAQTAVDEGRFDEAELTALRGLRTAEAIDDLAEIPFRVVLATIYVARDQTGFALAEFRRIVAINPAFEMDPVLTSPKVLGVFGQAKREYVEHVMSQPESYRLPEADAKLSASWRSALLPGWGQYYKQQRVKATVFGVVQAATLAAFVAYALETNKRKNEYLDIHEYGTPLIDERYNDYRAAYRTRNILGYLTLGVYLANYYDALYAPVRKKHQPVKIVIVGPAFPYRGGIAETTNSLSSALTARGHDVVIAGFRKQFPKILFPGKTQFVENKSARDLPPENMLVPWNPLSYWRTAQFIKSQNPDLICFKWWMPFFGKAYYWVAKFLNAKSRAKVAFICHNVIPHEKRFGDTILSKMALGRAKYFLTFSRNEAQELRELYPNCPQENIRFTPLPLFDRYDEFKDGQQAARAKLGLDAKKLLLFMGLIRQYKGLDILLRAMKEIVAQDPEVKLVVAGEFYEEQSKYDTLIDELGLRDHVIVRPGYVPADEIGTYLAAADVNVLPYRSATQSAILVLAYAHGCPVITTNVGGLSEVVEEGKTGYVVAPEEPAAIADGVKKFFESGGRAMFEPNVRAMSEKFSWDRPCEILEEFAKSK